LARRILPKSSTRISDNDGTCAGCSAAPSGRTVGNWPSTWATRIPDGVQHLLARADWDADAVRDDLLGYAREHLGHPDGVLVVDETGFLKKGAKSVGVARQYSGTAGRIENCQIGVLLGYATKKGRAPLDRALYLPKEWAGDADRREEAWVPEELEFATKIVLARRMIDRAIAAGLRAKWATADSVYGSDYHFRTAVEGHGLGYVVGVRTDFAVWAGFRQVRVGTLLTGIPAGAWHRLSCGDGAKGPRVYDWALSRTNSTEPDEYTRWVLIRRSASDPSEVAYFACGGPPATTLDELVRVAGARWSIEDLFELAMWGLWAGRVRGAELDRVAQARHPQPGRPGGRRGDPIACRHAGEKGGAKLIALSVPEVRKLLLWLVWDQVPEAEQVLAWSQWRRERQHRARRCRYRTRGARPPN
jgi:SRSO17 transposase